jgi:hypothetical protein
MNTDQLERNRTARGFSFGVGTIKAGDETFWQSGKIEALIPAGSVHSIKNPGENNSKIYLGYKAKTYKNCMQSDCLRPAADASVRRH